MRRRILTFSLLAGLAAAPGPASAQIQSTYDYLLRPHAPQSDSARTYSYDANGNLIRSTVRSTGGSKTLEYTPNNMIFKAGGSEYRYDTSGNRIAKIQRDANGNMTKIERYFGAIETDGTARTKYYFFGSKRIAKKSSSGTLSFYHADHLNSTSVVTSASGTLLSRMEFYELGAVKSQEGTDSPKYAYTGQEWDKETNLYNYNARMYDSTIGKFVSADTIIPNLKNPQSLNRYSYVRNNPLRSIDPTGHVDQPMEGLYQNFVASFSPPNHPIGFINNEFTHGILSKSLLRDEEGNTVPGPDGKPIPGVNWVEFYSTANTSSFNPADLTGSHLRCEYQAGCIANIQIDPSMWVNDTLSAEASRTKGGENVRGGLDLFANFFRSNTDARSFYSTVVPLVSGSSSHAYVEWGHSGRDGLGFFEDHVDFRLSFYKYNGEGPGTWINQDVQTTIPPTSFPDPMYKAFSEINLDPGRYIFYVTAIDAAGNMSVPSNAGAFERGP